jgi:heat shock protein HslJ
LRTTVVVGFVGLLAGGCESMSDFDDLPDFDSGPRAIAGTTWLADEIGGFGPGSATESTISFGNDQQIAGKGGCNTFLGPDELDGQRVTFGPFAMTRMMCGPTVAEQEDAFMLALANSATLEIDGDTMNLRDRDGNTVMSLSFVE